MFTTARFFLAIHPRPHTAIPGRRKPDLTAVSARTRRGGGGSRRTRSWDADGGGSDDEDDRIDASFFGDAPDEDPDPEPEPAEDEAAASRRASSPAAAETAGQLRGSDVLRALQRAAAAKEAKKRQKKAGTRPASRRRDAGAKRGGELVATAAGEARPIEIRREWATRIQELELRVQQLVDKYHHSPQ